MVDPGKIAQLDQELATASEIVNGLTDAFTVRDLTGSLNSAYAVQALVGEWTAEQLGYLVVVALQRLVRARRNDDVVDIDRLLDNLHEGLHDEEAQR